MSGIKLPHRLLRKLAVLVFLQHSIFGLQNASAYPIDLNGPVVDFGPIAGKQDGRSELPSALTGTGLEIDPATGRVKGVVEDIRIPQSGGLDVVVTRVFDAYQSFTRSDDFHDPSTFPTFGYHINQFRGGEIDGEWAILVAPRLVRTRYAGDNPVIQAEQLCSGRSWWQHWRGFGMAHWSGTTLTDQEYNYYIELVDGGIQPLLPVSKGVARSSSGWRLTCSDGIHVLTSPRGIVHKMDQTRYVDPRVIAPSQTYYATSIKDLSGNAISITYSNLHPSLPEKLASSGGAELTFSYDKYNRLSEIVDQSARTWRYKYGKPSNVFDKGYPYPYDEVSRPRYLERLLGVEFPGSYTVSYTYWPHIATTEALLIQCSQVSYLNQGQGCIDAARAGLIRSTILSTGGVVSFDYAFGPTMHVDFWPWDYLGNYPGFQQDLVTVPWEFWASRMQYTIQATSVKTSDGGLWHYKYSRSEERGVYDVSIVTGPAGVATYKYMGFGYFIPEGRKWSDFRPAFHWYYNYPPCCSQLTDLGQPVKYLVDSPWRLGLLAEKLVGDSYSEKYEYAPRLISNISGSGVLGPFHMVDAKSTSVGVLAKKTIVQDGAQYVTLYTNYDSYGNVGKIQESGPSGELRTIIRRYYIDEGRNLLKIPQSEAIE